MPMQSQPLPPDLEDMSAVQSAVLRDLSNPSDAAEDNTEGETIGGMFSYAGITKAVSDGTSGMGWTVGPAVNDDLEAEQESMGPEYADHEVESLKTDFAMDVDASQGASTSRISSTLASVLAGASTGVTEGTESHYKSLMRQCEAFLHEQNLIPPGEAFFSDTPREDAPQLICSWILNACDSYNLDGTVRDANDTRSSYSHAQKMRAAATFGFGRVHGLGNLPWHKSEISSRMLGNPSVSQQVSLYMVSLRRRKAHTGEEATSARAISATLIGQIYDFSRRPEYFDIKPFAPKSSKDRTKSWGGPRFRRLLHFVYTISFVCLLRIDEALKIRRNHIKMIGDDLLKLTLPFRKTNQFGDIKPFYIKMFPEEFGYPCPVRALLEWVRCSRATSGYICRKISPNDEVFEDSSEVMTSQQFLEGFRQNLLDIGVDGSYYGGHSFRRGGCQWLSVHRRWPLRKICEWGGWSTDFSHMTIVKYLISWNDNPMYPREDFFNLEKTPAIHCDMCGRSCDCYGL